MHNRTFAQANEVVNARYSMSLACHWLLVLALSKLRFKAGESTSLVTTITAQDWYSTFDAHADVIPISRGANAYRDLKAAANALQTTNAAVLRVPTDKGYGQKAWFEQIEHQEQHAQVLVVFSQGIRPHLTALATEFTVGELQAVAGFQSKHSYRIYMMLRQFRQTGVRQETVAELQAKLCTKYTSYARFKQRVIEPALDELKQAGIKIRVKEHKKGRSVQRLEFRFNSP